MTFETIRYEQDGPVAWLTFNRPEKRNALNSRMLDEIEAASRLAGGDDSVSVLVIRGAGLGFCSGMDVMASDAVSSDDPAVSSRVIHSRIQDRWLQLRELPKPVIAQVHGHCLGVATQICVCADITIAAEDARFGVPGMPNDWIGDWWVFRTGASRAKLMTYTTGNSISGVEAAAWGLATLAVPADRLEAETQRLAHWIAKTPLEMLRFKKRVLNQAEDAMGFRQVSERTAASNAIVARSAAATEVSAQLREHGLRATLERYRPEP
jgi:enoyl-CoA hydratase